MTNYKTYLYGAYGSNLNHNQMRFRCPNARAVTSLILPDYELVFRGVADIEASEGGEVMLGLWQITDACEKALDRYEGYPVLYKKEILDTDFGAIMVYTMNKKHDVYPPADAYLTGIAEGYDDFCMERAPLIKALNNSYTKTTV